MDLTRLVRSIDQMQIRINLSNFTNFQLAVDHAQVGLEDLKSIFGERDNKYCAQDFHGDHE